MGRKRYPPVYSEEEIKAMFRKMDESLEDALRRDKEREQMLLEALEELGPKRFIQMFVLFPESDKDSEFAPDPRFYPELRKRLEQVPSEGCPVDNLRASWVGRVWRELGRLRIELPLDADLKKYLPAMQAYQEYFQSLRRSDYLVRHLADEYGRGRRTYAELSDELNEATEAWANGDETSLLYKRYRALGLDEYYRRKGYTPEKYRRDYEQGKWPWDEERVTRVVKYYWTKK